MHNQLVILNGRILGDSQGKYTSIQKQGCSVVDYFVVTKRIFSQVNYLKIGNFTEYSDHKPLSINMRCKDICTNPSQPLESMYQSAPGRFIVNDENKIKFVKSLSSASSLLILQNLQESINTVHDNQNKDKSIIIKSVKDINKNSQNISKTLQLTLLNKQKTKQIRKEVTILGSTGRQELLSVNSEKLQNQLLNSHQVITYVKTFIKLKKHTKSY